MARTRNNEEQQQQHQLGYDVGSHECGDDEQIGTTHNKNNNGNGDSDGDGDDG
jgi:hypothetical protein